MANAQRDYVGEGFGKIERDMAFLMECLREVLEDAGESALARHLPWLKGSKPAGTPPFSARLCQTYSLAFQLLNMVEENVAAQMRRLRAGDAAGPESGLWLYQLRNLQALGMDAAAIAKALPAIRVEPVLTAHPTEAKRATVLEQHRAIYLLLVERENQMWTEDEKQRIRFRVKVALERLWRTGEVRLAKPGVPQERSLIMHHLRDVFPSVQPLLDLQLREAWRKAGFDPALLEKNSAFPQLRFGTWVGGDRDGHPLVTAEVTEETLSELRRGAVKVVERLLRSLPERLSLSDRLQKVPGSLKKGVVRLGKIAGIAPSKTISQRNSEETWRQFASLVLARLPQPGAARPGEYCEPVELRADLLVLRSALVEVGAERIARHDIDPALRVLEVFGFHLATLDVRQNSAFHDRAIGQMLSASGANDHDFGSWSADRRREMLERELATPRPFAPPGTIVGSEANAVLDSFAVLRRHLAEYGSAGLGSLIVSMTRDANDLLAVYLLAKEAGLAFHEKSGGLICPLPVVPLLETIEDLQAGEAILEDFLMHPVTRASLAWQREKTGVTSLVQQVMVGYSDSNKSGGILASQWELHIAQQRMTALGKRLGIAIRFFHGRGGTISRGAGPTHRFLEALPAGALGGDLRLTEQGESIAQKYANPLTATYNLELLLAGTAGVTLAREQGRGEDVEGGAEIAGFLATESQKAYRELLLADRFMEFYSQATPIDVLEHSRIGSRPARRTGVRSIDDLRAIPWVFSWNQSRFYLPGWFGVGSALESLARKDRKSFDLLCESIRTWPFMRYLMTNVETNLASADSAMMAKYGDLVEDAELREEFLRVILGEFRRTRRMLDRIFGGTPLARRRPRMLKTLQLRENALEVLHDQQIALIRTWRRAIADKHYAEADALLPDLLLSVNAIAGGLRTTG